MEQVSRRATRAERVVEMVDPETEGVLDEEEDDEA